MNMRVQLHLYTGYAIILSLIVYTLFSLYMAIVYRDMPFALNVVIGTGCMCTVFYCIRSTKSFFKGR